MIGAATRAGRPAGMTDDSCGYPPGVTQSEDRGNPGRAETERDREARLDPQRALDEAEKRILGDVSRFGGQPTSDDEGSDPVGEDGPGTGVDEEGPG